MKTKIFAMLFLVLLAIPFFASAAALPCTLKDASGNTVSVGPNDLPRCINQIYVWSLGVGALLALLMMIIGGYYYMTASGNAEQSGKGVEMIWGAVIGLALLFGAYLLLNTINPDLVKLDVSSFNGINNNQTPAP